jgi:hypothetical protein
MQAYRIVWIIICVLCIEIGTLSSKLLSQSPSDISHLADVYIKVYRQGTAYVYDLFWSKHPELLRPQGQFSVAMYEKYGYYEGYSEGLPGSKEFNVSAVPYGCFFHVESSNIPNYLDIYVNLGGCNTADVACICIYYIALYVRYFWQLTL